MAKIVDLGSAKPTDPIYSGGFEIFSPRTFRPVETGAPPSEVAASSEDASDVPEAVAPDDPPRSGT
jgi:hypothetical protein